MSEAPDPALVELRDVHLQFDEKEILKGVSLEANHLDRLVIMGQSGSGKSTILRLILGILQPDAGEVYFKHFDMTRLKRRKIQQIRRQLLPCQDLRQMQQCFSAPT